jgi:hypothetical protein
VRHARDEDLDRLEDLLAELRALPDLKEKKRGVFYLRSRAFLHFHEDPKGLFADIGGAAFGGPFERVDVTDAGGRARLMEIARERLAGGKAEGNRAKRAPAFKTKKRPPSPASALRIS